MSERERERGGRERERERDREEKIERREIGQTDRKEDI